MYLHERDVLASGAMFEEYESSVAARYLERFTDVARIKFRY